MNKGGTYGYLKKADIKDFEKLSFDNHDIVLLNGLPNQLPVVSGVLTVPFQTPLCHISLLCQNRGTPNATYRNWFLTSALEMEGRLPQLKLDKSAMIPEQILKGLSP